MKTIKLIAPAKVNLFLGIGRQRPDGYHDATTVMHSLALHDTVSMTRVDAGESVVLIEPESHAQPLREYSVEVVADSGLSVEAKSIWLEGIDPLDIPSDQNLACKAVLLLAEKLDRHVDECIRIIIEKHIPYQAGLGGGSSDAAAALLGAAELWGAASDDPRIEQAAEELGADVRFFLHGGCALLNGRGESFVHALEPMKETVAIVRPAQGVSTKQAYHAFDEHPAYPEQSLLDDVCAADRAADVPLFNNLEAPAERLADGLKQAREIIAATDGVTGVLLCGSGSALFAICDTYATAQKLSARAQANGCWARSTSFSSIRAALLPS